MTRFQHYKSICKISAPISGLALLLAASAANAGTPQNALAAIAVSPDGTTIAAAGDNRVLYVIDAESLEVQDRIWIGINPIRAHWNKDGKTVAIYHTDDEVWIYDAENWKVKKKIPKFDVYAISRQTEKLVTAKKDGEKDGIVTSLVSVYDLNSGKKLASEKVQLEVKGIGINADLTEIVLAGKQVDDKSEAKAEPNKDSPRFEQAIQRQKGDGKTAEYVWLDGELKETARNKSWFSIWNPDNLVIANGESYLLKSTNESVKLAKDGEFDMWEGKGVSSGSATVFNDDHSIMYSGGFGSGVIYNVTDREGVKFDVNDKLSGWPEYMQGVGLAPDGTTYYGTSAYRIIKVTPEGEIDTIEPIY